MLLFAIFSCANNVNPAKLSAQHKTNPIEKVFDIDSVYCIPMNGLMIFQFPKTQY
jgi:hypothetical protein